MTVERGDQLFNGQCFSNVTEVLKFIRCPWPVVDANEFVLTSSGAG